MTAVVEKKMEKIETQGFAWRDRSQEPIGNRGTNQVAQVPPQEFVVPALKELLTGITISRAPAAPRP